MANLINATVSVVCFVCAAALVAAGSPIFGSAFLLIAMYAWSEVGEA